MLPEVGVGLEGEVARVFEDEDAVVGEDVGGEEEVWERGEAVDGVGRVGEDDVEAAVGALEEVEDVGADHAEVGHLHASGFGLDEVGAVGVDVDGGYLARAARNKFEGDGAGAGEEVEDGALLEIDIVGEDVEKALARHVGGGAHREVGGRVEAAAAKGSGDDSHGVTVSVRGGRCGVF